MDVSKAKQEIPPPPPMSWQVFSHLYENIHIMVTWECKPHRSECPSLPSSPLPLCMLSMMQYGMEYLMSELGSAVSALSPPSLCTLSLLVDRVV